MHASTMSAIHVLVVAGVVNLLFSFLLGWLLSAKRIKEPVPPHHWLLVAHTVSLQEGLMLLGLSWAMTFARMSGQAAILGAWLLVAGSVFQDLSGVVNWLRKTGDQFAEKSTGWVLASTNAVLNTAGLAVVSYGIINGIR
ncbi:MAG TPA: hypothetical protein VHE35_12775 [Kofleriaceae bacterium]|nr:hypothetical protein [Kofleriaceae bacterium]